MAGSDRKSGLSLDDEGFAALMRPLGPFESAPVVAVAVSGGSDSMALALVAADWARRQGGWAVALTVDHGLRPASSAEARLVGDWMGQRGIEHHILTWRGAKPERGVQEAARDARYRLLSAYCRDRGILHLLLGHQMEDQAETFLMRLERGSGADGLAAMAPITARAGLRLLRPLLCLRRAALRHYLHRRGQDWIDDPSNENPVFARTRAGALLAGLEKDGLAAESLVEAAARLGEAREALEAASAALIARTVRLHPFGFARLRPEPINEAPRDVAVRALGWLLVCLGGAAYAPRRKRLLRLVDAVGRGRDFPGMTLAGCRIAPRRDGLLVFREEGRISGRVGISAGRTVAWDGRFELTMADVTGPAGAVTVAKLGEEGWRALRERGGVARPADLPASVLYGLPAIWDSDSETGAGAIEGPLAVPHLHYVAPGVGLAVGRQGCPVAVRFRPRRPIIPGNGNFWTLSCPG